MRIPSKLLHRLRNNKTVVSLICLFAIITLIIWGTSTYYVVYDKPLFEMNARSTPMGWLPSEDKLIYYSEGEIIIWDFELNEKNKNLQTPDIDDTWNFLRYQTSTNFDWSPDGSKIAISYINNTLNKVDILIWDPVLGIDLYRVTNTSLISHVVWDSDGSKFAYAHRVIIGDEQLTEIVVIDTNSWNILHKIESGINWDLDYNFPLIWSPNGQHIASLSNYGSITIWDLNTENMILQLKIPSIDRLFDYVRAYWFISWSPDGTKIAGSPSNPSSQVKSREVIIWSALTGIAIQIIKTGSDASFHGNIPVTWNPDSNKIAFEYRSPEHHLIKIWDIERNEKVRSFTLEHGFSSIGILRWSSDGTQILSGSSNYISIWNPNEPKMENKSFLDKLIISVENYLDFFYYVFATVSITLIIIAITNRYREQKLLKEQGIIKPLSHEQIRAKTITKWSIGALWLTYGFYIISHPIDNSLEGCEGSCSPTFYGIILIPYFIVMVIIFAVGQSARNSNTKEAADTLKFTNFVLIAFINLLLFPIRPTY